MSVEATASPTGFLTTRALLPRPANLMDLQTRLEAFCELSAILADDPRAALRRFLDTAVRLCKAGSAGLSLLRSDHAGRTVVRWEAVSGALASHEGIDAARDFSPCGLCLDAGATVLIAQPDRVFSYLRNTPPAIVEDLIVPLHDHGRPLGTLWIAHHDATSSFSSDDALVLEQLAVQLVLALKLLEQSTQSVYALALVQSHQLAHRRLLAHNLAEERDLRERAQASESELRQALMFKETAMQEVNHRLKNTLQVAASILSIHARATTSLPVRAALEDARGRLQLLATAHQMLYTGANSAQAIMMPALLQSVGEALRHSFSRSSVQLQIVAEPIELSPDEAIPIALLANEVITNAYKHAFPDGAAGLIAVNLSSAQEDVLILRIMDNGVGMQAAGDNGMGMKLISILAQQLHAALTFDKPTDAAGTVMTLRVHRGAKGRA